MGLLLCDEGDGAEYVCVGDDNSLLAKTSYLWQPVPSLPKRML